MPATARPARSSSPAAARTRKDDNAHVEQKNWTHVRKLMGYVRYDSPPALAAMNALYRHELRLSQILFLLCGGDQLAVAGQRRRRIVEIAGSPRNVYLKALSKPPECPLHRRAFPARLAAPAPRAAPA